MTWKRSNAAHLFESHPAADIDRLFTAIASAI
jgi:hypothetical protein